MDNKDRVLVLILVRSRGLLACLVRLFLRIRFGKKHGKYDHTALFDVLAYCVYDFDRPGFRAVDYCAYIKSKQEVFVTKLRTPVDVDKLAEGITLLQKQKYSDLYNLNFIVKKIWPRGYNCVRACCLLLGKGDQYAPPGEEAFK